MCQIALSSGASSLGYTAVFVFLAVLGVTSGVLAMAFGPRTTGVSLEAAPPSESHHTTQEPARP
ncbi:hypothetical protein ACIBCM_06695 [Streptomyces sp. NPDC051018]|uniref:hypothetical protein n=1 Tax=Streptomyces sp. NPDC051018 TaxID=3365639 RepID=UPI00379F9B85